MKITQFSFQQGLQSKKSVGTYLNIQIKLSSTCFNFLYFDLAFLKRDQSYLLLNTKILLTSSFFGGCPQMEIFLPV
jgi:hypothetical protein